MKIISSREPIIIVYKKKDNEVITVQRDFGNDDAQSGGLDAQRLRCVKCGASIELFEKFCDECSPDTA